MLSKDLSFSNPEKNILLDEVLFYLAENDKSDPILRFWEMTDPCLVLGRASNEEDDLFLDNILEDNLKVLRRCSGGGTVYQAKGCLNYALILPRTFNSHLAYLKGSYEFIVDYIIRALGSLNVQAEFRPISDIALKINNKKISGNAQKRGRRFILHHGTILYGLDFNPLERYLRIPKNVPEYRQGRSHQDFVANVPVGIKELKTAIKNVFCVSEEQNTLTSAEEKTLRHFLENKSPFVSFENFFQSPHYA
ncbi:MAG TPA: lipoate--protein ligase family protein [Candidatus Omnitrophota bacterium]|nr:lipoate--protein ligase family protein [Candidatus Omnitrophota bacterium]HPN87903.1 lipoate--protein ligase family protein [Candidatus Omnitrophota bacterium]